MVSFSHMHGFGEVELTKDGKVRCKVDENHHSFKRFKRHFRRVCLLCRSFIKEGYQE